MTLFDYAILAVIGLSIGLGWWRGLVYELLSLLGWVAAYFMARMFASTMLPFVPDAVGPEIARAALAYAGVFIGTLIASGVLAWVLSKLIKLVGLGLVDGMLGTLFGMLRGGLLVLFVVLLAGLTSLPKQRFWRDAVLSKPLQNIALSSKEFLPENVAKKISY